jgi:prepilin-type N-terminal cleavage/methylation domain-containing protein
MHIKNNKFWLLVQSTRTTYAYTMSRTDGFTITELIVTIVVIGILATLAVTVPTYFQKTARDDERADDTTSIARRLEQAYTAQEVGSPSYPTTTKLLSDISCSGGSGTVLRLSVDAFKAPNGTCSSVSMATSTSTTAPAGANTPTLTQYVYQPLTTSDSTAIVCTGASICVRFNLYYRRESDNSIQIIKSIHQQ